MSRSLIKQSRFFRLVKHTNKRTKKTQYRIELALNTAEKRAALIQNWLNLNGVSNLIDPYKNRQLSDGVSWKFRRPKDAEKALLLLILTFE